LPFFSGKHPTTVKQHNKISSIFFIRQALPSACNFLQG
jgi:hypothetical protein